MDEQGCLLAVDAAQAVGGALLLEAASGGVEPDDGCIPLENAAVADVGRGTERAVVKPAGGEAHDGIVHAVLDVEERNDVRFALRDLLHERTVQTGAGGFGAFDGGRQLVMVAGQDDAVGTRNGNPAGGFERLRRFVDEEGGEVAVRQHPVGRADEGGGDDPRFIEQLRIDFDFQFRGTLAQAGEAVAHGVAVGIAPAGFADGLTDAPKLRIVGVGLKTAFVGEREHFVVHARRVAPPRAWSSCLFRAAHAQWRPPGRRARG